MKVYVVTQGCYSDYHICEIFATEEAAKAYCEEANYFEGYTYEDSCSYYEYDLLEKIIEKQDKPCSIQCYFIDGKFDEDEFYIDGDNSYDEPEFDTYEDEDEFEHSITIERLNFPMVARKDETLEQFKDRAKKVAIDKYYQWKQEASNV